MSAVMEERAFSELKRLCCAGLDGPELLESVVERLRRAVPFEAYCASTADPASGLITRSLAGEMGGAEEAAIFFERLYFKYDLDQLRRMARERRSVVLLSETTGGNPEGSPRYRELLGPLGLAHEARTAFASGGHLWGSMDLIRATGSPDFSPREAAFLRRVAPHLATGLRTAALRARATAEPDVAGVPGVLALDGRGSVVRHTPAAEHLLLELEDLRSDWREWHGLPPAVRMVAYALKRALNPECGRDPDAVPRLRVRGRSGRWLTLYASLTEPVDGHPGETVIVIEPSKPQDVAWMSVAAYGLTPREEEIAGLVARGLSTRQISRTLFISEHTVQNHLRGVFEKVGVHSRRELVKRLFFDELYPSLFS
ncbi:Bacterial regulatory protein, luxR family [Rubrobacter radiotolerans]|uniref:Bacterial regulatory protein, luxR family n=1 Tax=Rubrobacter radiotolerans TaxID=42256 RepID=A0A023X6E3_RUBRA|nr:helix-turn-helix transcriptional regulator [Rubrobacter radiotolerans]AHY48027.1 Bacterial regulatory protein, luxR family [Rubrobacter radiotolerans]MDX5892666.1 helix-turn-helix transcriptional regulator [Rubrobacter radiotolerans]SMC08065.1 regulatory protein, luxR family [Rubrobacter radiotolerans DSM 5868]